MSGILQDIESSWDARTRVQIEILTLPFKVWVEDQSLELVVVSSHTHAHRMFSVMQDTELQDKLLKYIGQLLIVTFNAL
jgi:hypothetical protein